MRQTSSMKNATVKEISGRLVARDASRHYWIFEGSKWVRYGLKSIATLLHLGMAIISAMFRMVNGTKQATNKKKFEKQSYTVGFCIACLFILCIMGLSLACQGDVLMMHGQIQKGIANFVTGVLVSGVSILGTFKVFNL